MTSCNYLEKSNLMSFKELISVLSQVSWMFVIAQKFRYSPFRIHVIRRG